MNRIAIFVEGTGDVKFIKDFVREHFDYSLNNTEIIDVKGKDKLIDFQELMNEISDDNGNNIVIFDCDYPENGGGYDQRSQQLQNIISNSGVSFNFYLFPDNQSSGDLETLLENVINPLNKDIFDCWEAYEKCLSLKSNPYTKDNLFTIPAKKSKIYSYLECLLPNTKKGKEKVKDPKRDYRNREHWNIHTTNNLYVSKLRDFLNPFFE